jgi:hypothetical protein
LPAMVEHSAGALRAFEHSVRNYGGGFAPGFVGPADREVGNAKSYRNPLAALET